MAHAYFCTGDLEQGTQSALAFVQEQGVETTGNPDVQVYRYGLFSAEDARQVIQKASLAPTRGTQKFVLIAADRVFHETQNILLKSFEEPAGGTTFFLVVPSEGVLLATLRSRMVPLPRSMHTEDVSDAEQFLQGTQTAREKIVEQILARSKKDDPDEKQAARAQALTLVQGLTKVVYARNRTQENKELRAFLLDLDTFLPILHERAAPLKPILEHLVLVAPKRG